MTFWQHINQVQKLYGRKGDKFGISSIEEIFELCKYSANSKNLNLVGLACHIGSQILDLDGYIESANKIFELSNKLSVEGITLDFLDLGGGLGVTQIAGLLVKL